MKFDNKLRATVLACTAAFSASAVLVACGGGGGSSDGKPTSAITLSGTAATGAPMAGATVVVKDSTGGEVQDCAPCTVPADGKFSITLKATAKGPFVLFATQEVGEEPQVSMVDTATSSTVNITSLTTLIAARLSANGDPAALSASALTAKTIQTAATEVKDALKPLLDEAGVTADADLVTTAFDANSTGVDRALDAIGKPNIVRASDGKATVDIEIKTSQADGTDDGKPVKLSITPGAAPVATGLTPAIAQAALPTAGIGPKIQALLDRIQACHAIAPAERRLADATVGSQITAETCKGLFVDNDPSKFLHNNYVISKNGATVTTGRFAGAFNSIFSPVQGIKFDLPEFRYTVKNNNTSVTDRAMNGDVVFTARWTVTDPNAGTKVGQTDVGEYHARLQDGVLKLIGNQSRHDLQINAQARREEMPGAADYAYLATGYNINISERRWNNNGNKESIYEQVVVTSPNERTFTLKPIPGNNHDYLGLVKPSDASFATATATVRLTGAYLNAATTGHPSTRFTKEFWANASDWAKENIAAIPAQGNWRFDITLTDAFYDANKTGGTTKTRTEHRRAINRAPTLDEVKAVQWPTLKDPISSTLTTAATSGSGDVSIGANGSPAALVIDGWDVPTGAWSPTRAKVYGSNWDEGVDVASTARQATIPCAGTGTQCEKSGNSNTGKFVNASWGYLQFWGRDSKRLQMSLNYSTHKTSQD